jgi:hypothetical protein
LEKESFLTEEDIHTSNNDENSPKFKAVSYSGTNITGDHYEIKVKAADDLGILGDEKAVGALSLSQLSSLS